MSSPPRRLDRRTCLAGIAASVPAVAVARARDYHAVVVQPGRAAPAGRRFASIAEALSGARDGATIWIGAGVWREKLTVVTPNLTLIGEDRGGTRLSFDAAAGLSRPDGTPWGTFGSATLSVTAPGFAARNLTIENGFDPANASLSAERPRGQQAVALMLGEGSERAAFDGVDIVGRQDTLLANAGRAVFRRCLVSGTVDFIFGAGEARFEGCEIRSRRPNVPSGPGYVAAPSTSLGQAAGLSFVGCRLTREEGVADGSVFLARPWRPTRRFADGSYGDPDAAGLAMFERCWMDSHIAAARWSAMTYHDRAGQVVALTPAEARFTERGSMGPGARRR